MIAEVGAELDVLIRGGQVVYPHMTLSADLGVRGGKVAWVGSAGVDLSARSTIDATGLHVLPGVIDPHVHMTSPGTIEQFCVKHMPSMVTGGVTTCIHFAETTDSYLPLLHSDREAIERHALVDVGFHMILMREIHLAELPECLARFGVMSYKMYFAAGGEEIYPGTFTVDDGFLFRAFRQIAKLGPGTIAMAHCENWEIARALTSELKAAGRTDAGVWTDARPAFCEEDAMRRAIFLAGVAGCPLYIVHSSIGKVTALVAQAVADGIDVVAETCPHYLTIHRDHPQALEAKYYPSVKSQQDLEALWGGLRDRWISTVGSDHIPMNEIGGPDIWQTEGGLPGSATILPVLLSEGVNKGRLTLERVVEVCSTAPARTFGLSPRKGLLVPGADADVVLVDLEKRVTFHHDMLHLPVALFDGWEFRGWPVLTMLRGEVVAVDGNVVATEGAGRYVREVSV